MRPTPLDQKLYDLGFAPTAYWDSEHTNGTLLVDASYVEIELPETIGKTMIPWFSTDSLAELVPYWLTVNRIPSLKENVIKQLMWAVDNGHVDPIHYQAGAKTFP